MTVYDKFIMISFMFYDLETIIIPCNNIRTYNINLVMPIILVCLIFFTLLAIPLS